MISVDTYKPQLARAAIAAGASIVNDVSGLRDPLLAEVCAETGAALVVMHTRAAPRERLQDPDMYADVVAEVLAFLRERIALALAAGVAHEQLIVDPGPDFAKTPAQTIQLLAHVERLHELQRPLLMAISRKDFVGALTARPPRERLAGTLAALAHGLDAGAHIFRVHDVAACADFLAVREALRADGSIAGARRAGISRSPRNCATSGRATDRTQRARPVPVARASRRGQPLGLQYQRVPAAVQRCGTPAAPSNRRRSTTCQYSSAPS